MDRSRFEADARQSALRAVFRVQTCGMDKMERVDLFKFEHIGPTEELTFDFERFGGFEQGADLFLRDVHFAAILELQDGADFRVLDVFEDDDRMRARVVNEQRLEVGRTSGQDHFVAFDGGTTYGQRHVRERFRLQQLLEDGQQVGPVIIPAEAVLLATRSTHVAH